MTVPILGFEYDYINSTRRISGTTHTTTGRIFVPLSVLPSPQEKTIYQYSK